MVFRAVSRFRPDLIIVYSGNNEYNVLRALKARSDRYDPAAELLRRRLSRYSYIYRQLRDLVQPADTLAPPEGVEWLPIGRLDVLVNEDDRALGQMLYAEHLTEMILAAQAHDVPILLTTVASNLRDHVDNATPGEITHEAEARLHQLGEMMDKADRADFLSAVDIARPLLQSEGAQFRLGRLLLRGGMRDAAFKAFENAEVLALRPMTSDRVLRQTVKDVGAQHDVPVCDLAGALAASAEEGSPGSDLFIDHCHPNAEGHRRLGDALTRCVVQTDLLKLSVTDTDLAAAIAAMDAHEVDPYRLDLFTGHRRIPGLKGDKLAATGTPLGATQRGHKAFVANRFDDALAAYLRAESLGAAPAVMAINQGLTQLYRGDLAAARAAFDRAQAADPGDLDIAQARATLGP